MHFDVKWQGAKALVIVLGVLLAACGGGKGDSKKFSQIIDADKQGIVSIALVDNDGYVHLRGSKQFVLEGTNRENAKVDISNKASWRLSDTSLGKIDRTGLLTPSGQPGELTLTASYAEFVVSQPVIISNADLVSINITPKTTSVDVCKNAEFTAEALFDNGLVLDYPLEWRLADSQSEALASFPDKSKGLMATRKSGSVNLIAEGKNNAGSTISASPLSFTIDDTLARLVLSAPDAENLRLSEGQETDIRATATWTDNSTAIITSNAALTVSDANAASINAETGRFTAKTGSYAGTPVTITGNCDEVTAELVFTLIKPQIRRIEIRSSGGNTTSVSISRGNSTSLLVTATFENNAGTDTDYKHNLDWRIVEDDSNDFNRDKIRISSSGQLTVDGDLEMEQRIDLVIEARVLDAEGNILKNTAGEEISDRINAVITL